jgi:uncharacterized membrane protein (UPF0182 family)
MRGSVPRVGRRGKVTLAVVSVIILFLVFLDQIVALWTNWLWFEEVGFTSVFGGIIRTRIWLFLLFGLIVGGFVGGNLYLAYRLRPLVPMTPDQQALERYRMILSPHIGLWIALAGGAVGLFAGLSGQARWSQWLLFQNRVDFGVTDPEFGIDVGYYVFELPFWRYLLDVGFTTTALAVLGVLAVHYLYGGVRLQGAGDRITAAARVHLTSLVALFVLLKAAAYFLDRRTMMLKLNTGTETWGAGYTDINAVLPAKEILAYISIVVAIAILVFSNVGSRNLTWAGASLALLGVSAVAIGGIYPMVVQQVTVNPNRPTREAEYIKRSIDATRAAFGIDNVERTEYLSDVVEPPDSLATDTTVVPTIRLLDPAVVNETFTQYQQIRGFYNFPEKLDVDRYVVNGRLQDFVVGVRELDYSRLEGQQTNWQNRHTVFTHGYGFVAAPANTTCDGEPFFVSGILVQSQGGQGSRCVAPTDSIVVTQPRIYYGELFGAGDFVIVGKADGATADAEFDRPQGDSQENYTYTGAGGVPINSMFRRMLYGLHFWDANFLLFDGFNENSKILYNRNPRERVEMVAPFLTLDGDPYPAVIDGRVVWILDAYTTSANYPYSQVVDLRQATSDALSDRGTILQARQNVNYMRNSVKATVDAYDGTVTLYAFDESDPVLRAWNQAFGGNIIKPHSAIPPELAAHFRYPEDLFKVQRDLLAKFHVSNPVEFNNGQDFWQVPNDPASSTDAGVAVSAKQPPYYLLTQFPGVTEPRFQLTAAMTPRDRQNLAALLTGVITPDGLKLEMLELPRDGRIPGPGQAQQQMITNNDVIQQITYLSGQGTADFIYGNLLSLPYGGGLLYVQPVYLKSSISTQIPLMRLVLVSYGNYVSFAPTLSEAISKLVAAAPGTETPPSTPPEQPPSGTPTPDPTTPPPSVGEVVMTPQLQAALDRLDAAIRRVEEAQRSGDFAAYGAALAELHAAMDAVKAAQDAARTSNTPVTTPSPTG